MNFSDSKHANWISTSYQQLHHQKQQQQWREYSILVASTTLVQIGVLREREDILGLFVLAMFDKIK